MPSDLTQLDPAQAWQPWRPSAADPWGRKWAAHLYRRAGFGPNREELLEAEHLGHEGTLELLLRGRSASEELQETLNDVGRIAAGRDDGDSEIRGWWLYCMLQAGHPLREKMALFWHNHFATSIAKVQNPVMMFRQNCLIRAHSLGHFRPFVHAIAKDPAMLFWLDSNSNVRGRPNENFARELMELFTMGVGNYTEKDVREAARAFTGWHTNGETFTFKPELHDGGPKTILGRTGNWNGDDVIRLILDRPATARFLVRKLYHFLVSENAEPPDSFLEPLADGFRKSGYDISALLRAMLSSKHFFSDYAFRQRIKSPVEYVLSAVRTVYRRYSEADAEYKPLPQQVLVPWLWAMGQVLFAPPNVKGWPGGRSWLNTSTLLARDNFSAALAMGTLWTEPSTGQGTGVLFSTSGGNRSGGIGTNRNGPPRKAFDSARLLEEERVSGQGGGYDRIVGLLLDLYLPGGVRAEERSALINFLADGKPSGSELAQRVRETVHAILTMAEYQLA
jgi:hypothetical protein